MPTPPDKSGALPPPRSQERIRIPDDKMEYYKDLAEMYVGDDVSPDFYGWVFPKYDHVAVGASRPLPTLRVFRMGDTISARGIPMSRAQRGWVR